MDDVESGPLVQYPWRTPKAVAARAIAFALAELQPARPSEFEAAARELAALLGVSVPLDRVRQEVALALGCGRNLAEYAAQEAAHLDAAGRATVVHTICRVYAARGSLDDLKLMVLMGLADALDYPCERMLTAVNRTLSVVARA